MICQSEFISDSNFMVVLSAISCRIRIRIRMSLRGTRQSHQDYFLVFVGTDYKSTLSVAGKIQAVGNLFQILILWNH